MNICYKMRNTAFSDMKDLFSVSVNTPNHSFSSFQLLCIQQDVNQQLILFYCIDDHTICTGSPI